ncbi:zinc finger protein ZFP2 [Drosophila virilis]|uniref:Protein krueppel n=1 Tax=Drosophila virilis TaxID=7244 RepID=B4LGE6_DROVI|nr:gastrula zinc finger protein XlCGF57.1 [Drosophila virilis]EDW70475.1 uncharacterized protein Dvir_GJ11511 [Drosophila virilis]
MEEVCRICRSNCVTLVNIFDQLEQDPPLVDMLKECGNCKIYPNDPLPQNICLACILDAQNAFQFKRRCEHSQQYFLLLLDVESKDDSDCHDVRVQCTLDIKEEPLENVPTESSANNGSVKDSETSSTTLLPDVENKNKPNCEEAVPNSQCFLDVKEEPLEHILPENSVDNESFEDNGVSSTASLCEQQNTEELDSRTTDKNKSYPCLTCGKVFSFKSDLTKHSRIHNGRYKCTHCSRAFNSSSTCKLHIRLHTGERPFKCTHCTAEFLRNDDLKRHMFKHTGERPYECPHCLKRFTHRSILNKHIRTHTNDRKHKCPHCQKAFTDGYTLKVHIRRCTGERPFQCADCPKAFVLKKELQLHQNTHLDYKCPSCSGRCSAAQLKRHSSGHTLGEEAPHEMPTRADSCKEEHPSSLSLDAPHSEILLAESPEDVNPKEGRHMDERHPYDQKTFQCETCDKSFATKGRLIQHYGVHTDERPFKCEICSKAFKQRSHLTKHSVTHTRKNYN